MPSRIALPGRLSTLAIVAVLALGVAACGGSDDDDGGGGSDRQQARATVEALYAAIADGDAEEVCDQLGEDAQKQIADGGLGGKSKSCPESFQKFLDEAEKGGGLNLTLKAKVENVKVTGDDAVATVSFGKGREGEIPLSKVDGDWKLDAAGASTR
jgi:hypothetical protein